MKQVNVFINLKSTRAKSLTYSIIIKEIKLSLARLIKQLLFGISKMEQKYKDYKVITAR